MRLWLILSLNLMAALLSAGFVLLALTRPLGAPGEPRLLILAEDHLREEAARVGLREGRLAPGFGADAGASLSLTDLDGRPMDLAELSGQPVWIVFWATYCHACQEEEPDLRRAHDAHRDDGLVVLAIDAGEAADDVRRYVEERRLPWRTRSLLSEVTRDAMVSAMSERAAHRPDCLASGASNVLGCLWCYLLTVHTVA